MKYAHSKEGIRATEYYNLYAHGEYTHDEAVDGLVRNCKMSNKDAVSFLQQCEAEDPL